MNRDAETDDERQTARAALVFLMDEADALGIDLADDVTAERQLQAAARVLRATEL